MFSVIFCNAQDSIYAHNINELKKIKNYYAEYCINAKSQNVATRVNIKCDLEKIKLLNKFYKNKEKGVDYIISLFDTATNLKSRWQDKDHEVIQIRSSYDIGSLDYSIQILLRDGKPYNGDLTVSFEKKLFCTKETFVVVFDYLYYNKYLLKETFFPLDICINCPASITKLW